MSFWQAYWEAVRSLLGALWFLARVWVVVGALMWFWWRGWYIALAIATIVIIAGVLALQARSIQRWSRH